MKSRTFKSPRRGTPGACLGKILMVILGVMLLGKAADAAIMFDIHPDQDVDGLDLLLFKKGYSSVYTDLGGFAAEFGVGAFGSGYHGLKTYGIAGRTDDAEENKATGRVDIVSSDIELAYDQGLSKNQIVGLRFAGIDIPQGADIKSAHLRFFTNNDHSTGPVDLTIAGEAHDHSAPFSAVDRNISSRPKTNARVSWSPPDWSEPWVSKDVQKSSNLRNVIHEIISRPGFVSGNAISLFIEGTGTNMRNSYSYDYYLNYPDRKRYARLIIEHEIPEPQCSRIPVILDTAAAAFLPDYSYAGYKWGEEEIPNVGAGGSQNTYVDIRSFGATADDENDDTQAIIAAIAAHADTPGFVLLHFPAGRFLVSDVIVVDRSHILLQGEGSGTDGTVFQINMPLSDPRVTKTPDILRLEEEYNASGWPMETNGRRYSLYSWMGGFFCTRYNGDRFFKERIADVVSGVRGEKTFTIANQQRAITPMEVIYFEWDNPADNAFLNYLLGDEPVTVGSGVSGASSNLVVQAVTVAAVDGAIVGIHEPLLHDIGQPGRTWTARIRTAHFLEQVGFENFRIVFPDSAGYAGHHLEAGYNAFYLTDLQHSWVRNVSIQAADSGILIDYGKNITLENIKTMSSILRESHYDISIGRSYGVLVKNFDFRARAIHTPSFNTACTLSVFANGYVDVAAFDQHMGLNHQNLFDNIVVGYTPNLFQHGGSGSALPTAARYNTFWNITVRELAYDNLAGACADAPGAGIIGLHSPGNTLMLNYTPAPYIEGLNECLAISSLVDHQLNARSGSGHSALRREP